MAESGDLAREELPLASIVADRVAIQPRIQLDEEAIEAYAEAVEKLPPVVVFRDPESGRSWLADGFHRLEAHIRAGRDTIPAVVRVGGKREASREAMFWAVGANRTNGVRMTAADRRRAVAMILSDPEGVQWPDSAIGDHCGVTAATVLAARKAMLERGEIEEAPVRTDPTTGRVRKARSDMGSARDQDRKSCDNATTGKTIVNGSVVDDPPDIAARRKAGAIPADAVVTIDDPHPAEDVTIATDYPLCPRRR